MRKRGQEHIKQYILQKNQYANMEFPFLEKPIVQDVEKSEELLHIYEIKAKFSLAKGEAYLILLSALIESDDAFREIMEEVMGMNLVVAEDFFIQNYPEAVFSVRKDVLLDLIFDELDERLRLKPQVLSFILGETSISSIGEISIAEK